jgi:hypothetical protein
MPTSILVLCFGGVGLALIVASVARRARKTRTACFDSREMLSIGQWCSAYFPNLPQQTVAECLATISRITGIDAGRLRPTDRFDAELKLPRGNFIAGEWDDVEDQIAKRCQHVQREAKVLTIGDYIELMGASR